MNDQKYNGWTNYETWAVSLWLGNEEQSYNYWREAAQEERKQARCEQGFVWTVDEAARYNLADRLKRELEDNMPDLGASMWADLLQASFSEVNWSEIARHMLEE